MTRSFRFVWICLGLATLMTSASCGCSKKNPSATPGPANPLGPRYDMMVGDQVIQVELAVTPARLHLGLMHRTDIPEGTGMLFVYPQPQTLNFWMKNTPSPLSIGFIDTSLTLAQIEDLAPFDETTISSHQPAQYALEVPQGYFHKMKISPGARVILSAPLRQAIKQHQ